MKKYLDILKKIQLFIGISPDELLAMMRCLNANVRTYEKGSYIFHAGDAVTHIGILLSGGAEIVKEDAFGKKTIVSVLESTDLFAEVMVCAGNKISPVSVLVTERAEVLFIDYAKIVFVCDKACAFHHQLIMNMLKLLAGKNIILMKKLDYATLKGMREKLSAFLLDMYDGEHEFEIPFNREQMADFLSVDRSAMSRELCRMRDEGLISFTKNRFRIIKQI